MSRVAPLRLEEVEATYQAAWNAWEALHEALPVYRSREQQRQLDAAYAAVDRAKWFLDKARRSAA